MDTTLCLVYQRACQGFNSLKFSFKEKKFWLLFTWSYWTVVLMNIIFSETVFHMEVVERFQVGFLLKFTIETLKKGQYYTWKEISISNA